MKRAIIYYLFILPVVYLQGCSFIPERSYSDLMDEQEEFYVPERDFILTSGDSGERYASMDQMLSRTPAAFDPNDTSVSPELREKYQLEQELARLEQTQPPMFQEMYWQYKEDFRNNSERIYFLGLPSLKDRELYLSSRGMKSADKQPKYVSELISKEDHREILSGMSPIQVRKIAGNPSYVESASFDGTSRWATAYQTTESGIFILSKAWSRDGVRKFHPKIQFPI